ncbi:MAG: hypothetical protein RLY86_1878 [Pseudomonadota bacterium]|jgi:hypothetical protein
MARRPRAMRQEKPATPTPAPRGNADILGRPTPARRGDGRASPHHRRGPAKAPVTGFAPGKETHPAEPRSHNPCLSLLPWIRPPTGGTRAANPGRSGGATPAPCPCRSRVPLIGLARLHRALRAGMPCSTQSRHRTAILASAGLRTGDADTGTPATGTVPAATESGYPVPPGGCAQAYSQHNAGALPHRGAMRTGGKPQWAWEAWAWERKRGPGGTGARKRPGSSDSSSL